MLLARQNTMLFEEDNSVLHRSCSIDPLYHTPAAAAANIREDGRATGRAETVTLDSRVIRSMTSGKSPLDGIQGRLFCYLFSLLSPGCPSSSIWATESAFVFSPCVYVFCFPACSMMLVLSLH